MKVPWFCKIRHASSAQQCRVSSNVMLLWQILNLVITDEDLWFGKT